MSCNLWKNIFGNPVHSTFIILEIHINISIYYSILYNEAQKLIMVRVRVTQRDTRDILKGAKSKQITKLPHVGSSKSNFFIKLDK